MPALDAQTPSSTSARASTSTSRAAYGAPEAPVMPTKMRKAPLLRALRRIQKLPELVELLIAESRELRHHVVAGLGRVRDVVGESLHAEAALADGREVRRAEVRAAGPEIRVTCGAAGAGEDDRAGDSVLVVLEGLALRPRGHCLDDLARKRLVRGRALVREHTHRQHDQHCRDHRDRSAQQAPLAPQIEERPQYPNK